MTRAEILGMLHSAALTLSDRPVEAWTEGHSLAQLGIDSAQILELVAEAEDRLGVELPLDVLGRMETVGELVAELERRVAAR